MQPANYHPQLSSQIREVFGETAELPPGIEGLLQKISQTYAQNDTYQTQLEAKIAQSAEQLIASTSRAYSFLDSLHMGLIMCDVNSQVVFTNLSVRHLLAMKAIVSDRQQISEQEVHWDIDTIDKLLQPSFQLKERVKQSLQTNQALEFKAVNFGKRVLRLFIAPMVNETGLAVQQFGTVVLVEDVTEQVVHERSRDEFFSIGSHELRTPLTAIRGNASLIKNYYGDKLPDNDVVEMIDDIHESAVRLIQIVNDFLDVSALEQGKIQMNPEAFLPGGIVQDVVHDLHALCESKTVSLIADPNVMAVPAIKADKQRFKQVIYNLVGNAIKFTDSGSISISAQIDGNYVRFAVTDTGTGMSAENQRLLFRKFQQAGSSLLSRDNTKGTGLGLYISKLIVEMSGGKIGLARSELGKGSTFAFTLPRAEVSAETQSGPEQVAQ